jgi:hypothetical protein
VTVATQNPPHHRRITAVLNRCFRNSNNQSVLTAVANRGELVHHTNRGAWRTPKVQNAPHLQAVRRFTCVAVLQSARHSGGSKRHSRQARLPRFGFIGFDERLVADHEV